MKIGEVSVAIGVASPHREEAFEACRYPIDTRGGDRPPAQGAGWDT